jgi:hypothetical protein
MTQTARIIGPDVDNWVETDPANNTSTDVNLVSPLRVLGSEPSILWPSDSLEPGQTDRFQITAHSTGLLRVTAHAQAAGLRVAVDDRNGNPIAGGDSVESGMPLVVPVVSQETYFVRVINAAGDVTIG